MDYTQLHLSISGKDQTVDYRELLEVRGKQGPSEWKEKLSLEIRSDSYSFQSYALAKIYDSQTRKWNVLASIHPSLMDTKHGLGYGPVKPSERDFAKDARELLRQAELILT